MCCSYCKPLAHDFDIPNIRSHVVHIVKHVRNNHQAAAAFKQAGGSKLVLPIETRWNSIGDCLESYLKNWPVLASIDLSENIAAKVQDLNIRRNAEDMLRRMKPISAALSQLESNSCKISDAVVIWKNMRVKLNEIPLSTTDKQNIKKRSTQVMTDYHFLAFLLNPRNVGKECLSEDEESRAMEVAENEYPTLLSIITNLKTKSPPFNKSYLFSDSMLKNTSTSSWWKALQNKIDREDLGTILALLNATASSASVERVFSTFGLVHSQLRNKLGIEKGGKLVFLHKLLNQ